jgi:endonuclease/exonuclease/phosphatase (EEP) superfamily protein YafD
MISNNVNDNKEIPKRKNLWFRIGFLLISAVLCLFLYVCYSWQWDKCAAVTIFPVWAWLLPGFFLTGIGFHKRLKWPVAGVLFLWIIFLFSFAEESRSLLRSRSCSIPQWETARRQGKALRIVSLNCAGAENAAREILAYNPDIILLQESPGREMVKNMAQTIFKENAGYVWNFDTSILARGKISREEKSTFFARTCIRLPSGREIYVISLRLVPPVVRMDLWSLGCWRDQTRNRRQHRTQIQKIAQQIQSIPQTMPIIIGGDFNAPAGDGAMESLHSRLQDTFKEAGIGWGNTGLNDIPVSRVDQIWATNHFQPVAVSAVKTVHSDHRMVICDLLFKKPN